MDLILTQGFPDPFLTFSLVCNLGVFLVVFSYSICVVLGFHRSRTSIFSFTPTYLSLLLTRVFIISSLIAHSGICTLVPRGSLVKAHVYLVWLRGSYEA